MTKKSRGNQPPLVWCLFFPSGFACTKPSASLELCVPLTLSGSALSAVPAHGANRDSPSQGQMCAWALAESQLPQLCPRALHGAEEGKVQQLRRQNLSCCAPELELPHSLVLQPHTAEVWMLLLPRVP